MVWFPAAKLLTVKVAWPAELSAPEPSVLPPSLKVTVPDRAAAVVEPGGLTVTVAVKVTVWPDTAGLAEEARTVLVAAAFTVCVSAALVLAWKLVLPP